MDLKLLGIRLHFFRLRLFRLRVKDKKIIPRWPQLIHLKCGNLSEKQNQQAARILSSKPRVMRSTFIGYTVFTTTGQFLQIFHMIILIFMALWRTMSTQNFFYSSDSISMEFINEFEKLVLSMSIHPMPMFSLQKILYLIISTLLDLGKMLKSEHRISSLIWDRLILM